MEAWRSLVLATSLVVMLSVQRSAAEYGGSQSHLYCRLVRKDLISKMDRLKQTLPDIAELVESLMMDCCTSSDSNSTSIATSTTTPTTTPTSDTDTHTATHIFTATTPPTTIPTTTPTTTTKTIPTSTSTTTFETTDTQTECPSGFVKLVPDEAMCYKMVKEFLPWDQGQGRCASLDPRAHLAYVTNSKQNDAIVNYLKTFQGDSECGIPGEHEEYFQTSGQRLNPANCTSRFFWKPSTFEPFPISYTNWWTGEPNCQESKEACVHYKCKNGDCKWNDIPCSDRGCLLCQLDADRNPVSFSAPKVAIWPPMTELRFKRKQKL